MYRKPKIEDSLARNMFLGSNMEFCMSDVTSERVNNMERSSFEYSLLGQKKIQYVKYGLFVRMIKHPKISI